MDLRQNELMRLPDEYVEAILSFGPDVTPDAVFEPGAFDTEDADE